MDKFAVVLDDEFMKTATAGAAPCPSCGSRKVNHMGGHPPLSQLWDSPLGEAWQERRRPPPPQQPVAELVRSSTS